MKIRIIISLLIIGFLLLKYQKCKQKNPIEEITPTIQETTKPKKEIYKWAQKERTYNHILSPIRKMKKSEPKIYDFIISWLGTNYNTPNWNGYASESWQDNTMKYGIDCSGFARVMQDQIFNKKIKGSSKGIYKSYCKKIPINELRLGDLIFFHAPNATSKRIVHVGTFLQEDYFVHATSKRSAKEGKGVDISRLSEPRWSKNIVACGRVK